jgi:hypothetical protein
VGRSATAGSSGAGEGAGGGLGAWSAGNESKTGVPREDAEALEPRDNSRAPWAGVADDGTAVLIVRNPFQKVLSAGLPPQRSSALCAAVGGIGIEGAGLEFWEKSDAYADFTAQVTKGRHFGEERIRRRFTGLHEECPRLAFSQ